MGHFRSIWILSTLLFLGIGLAPGKAHAECVLHCDILAPSKTVLVHTDTINPLAFLPFGISWQKIEIRTGENSHTTVQFTAFDMLPAKILHLCNQAAFTTRNPLHFTIRI